MFGLCMQTDQHLGTVQLPQEVVDKYEVVEVLQDFDEE